MGGLGSHIILPRSSLKSMELITESLHHITHKKMVKWKAPIIEGFLTKTIVSHQRNWAEKLPEVLWAYRTTWRNTTGFSPYELVYGKNPLFPIEFEIKTLRTTLRVDLDLSTT